MANAQQTLELLTPKQRAAAEEIFAFLRPHLQQSQQTMAAPDIVDWAHRNYCISDRRGLPIILMRHQQSLMRYMLDPNNDFQTIIWSTIKKSGKTAVAGVMGRYLAEHSGPRAEVYAVANDLEQARSRAHQSIVASIELAPGFDRNRRLLPDNWQIYQKHAEHLPTGSIIRAIATDAAGEAGSNPVATLWTELWAYKSEAAQRLWAELTPVLTRARSLRIVETYAGYEDESVTLYDLYRLGLEGRQLTHDDIDWPFPDRPPVWVNDKARLCMYWDSGEIARRMPWQQGPRAEAYYGSETQTLRPVEFNRLHMNLWGSSVSEFIPIEWWQRLAEDLPPLDNRTNVVLAVDASVSGACTAYAGITRHPTRPQDVALRFSRKWQPTNNRKVDHVEVENAIRDVCKQYNVVQIAYDQYQLHGMMQRLTQDAVSWCRVFSQAGPRAVADKQLYDVIKDRRIAHSGDPDVEEHLRNAAARESMMEQGKLRLEQKNQTRYIDLAVCLSMGVSECLRLNVD